LNRSNHFYCLFSTVLVFCLAIFGVLPATAADADATNNDKVEPRLVSALSKVRSQQIDSALEDVKVLIKEQPNFKLAQLVYADLLAVKSGQFQGFGNGKETPGNRIAKLRHEAKVRWARHAAPPPKDYLPRELLQLSFEQTSAVAIDLERARIYLFANELDGLRLVRDFYVSSAKNGPGKLVEGDEKSPIGVYVVTSEIDQKKLGDLYGSGAFPIDYPNTWDKLLGKTGYGIWLHGVPSSTYSRVPRDSEGCIALANKDLDSLRSYLLPGRTPVIISQRLEWIPRQEVEAARQTLKASLEQWRQDWESLDYDAYIRHYSPDFKTKKRDYFEWAAYKKRVNSAKSFITVELSNVSMFAYPDEQDMAVIDFNQKYRSSNIKGTVRKRQYWRKGSDDVWRIIYEGGV